MKQIQQQIETETVSDLFRRYPFLDTYMAGQGLELTGSEQATIPALLAALDLQEIEDKAIDAEAIITGAVACIEQMLHFLGDIITGAVACIEQMLHFLGDGEERQVAEISLYPGTDKSGAAERFTELTIRRGEIVSIVGPTGSGKSRLLADIEWMAQEDTPQEDTPTRRKLLVNGKVPDPKWRFSSSDKLVAQLSQNMNFVMDLTVEEFIRLHADSRMVNNVQEVVASIIREESSLRRIRR